MKTNWSTAVSIGGVPPKRFTKPFFVRRHVDRRILRFSIAIGVVGVLLTACVYLYPAYDDLQSSQKTNLRTLSEINCANPTCDTSEFSTDWQLGGPDYLVDRQTRYFLSVPSPQQERPTRF